jgi:AcrR family transcriptional regulator
VSTSGLRQRQAAATRLRVRRAARRVFTARGYSPATIAEVAKAAGVAVPTVYKLYRSKRGLLAAVIEGWRSEFVPAGFEAVPGDPRAALAFWAGTIRRQWQHGLDIAALLASAAASEPEVADELSARMKARDAWVRRVAEIIEPNLAPGLTPAQAAALLSALALPELYRELVIVRGWTPDAYQAWLERTLTSQLLATSQPRSRRTKAPEGPA